MEERFIILFIVLLVKLDSRKTERLLGRQPKFNKLHFPFFLVTFEFVFEYFCFLVLVLIFWFLEFKVGYESGES